MGPRARSPAFPYEWSWRALKKLEEDEYDAGYAYPAHDENQSPSESTAGKGKHAA